MNERIRHLAVLAGMVKFPPSIETELQKNILFGDNHIEQFALLIVKECADLNKKQSYELLGVITDVEEGNGFDEVCLNTVKRVADYLGTDLKQHFGVES